jgi:hypothetical protein
MKQLLNEGLKHMDMKGYVFPILEIDKYESTIGSDDDLVTINFISKSPACASDLAEWLERGYDWVIDASTSPGEVKPGKYITFVEVKRRLAVPARVIEIINDLDTLTDLKLDQWKITVGDIEVENTAESIAKHLQTNPQDYRDSHPDDTGDDTLNEWKQIAGVSMTTVKNKDSDAILAIKRQAGLI